MGVVRRTATEMVRHLLFRLNAGVIRDLRGTKTGYLEEGDHKTRFLRIYKDHVWASSGKVAGDEREPGSGAGSSLRATSSIQAALPDVLRDLGAEVFMDVGCGDQTWISMLNLPARYIGIDILPRVIEANRANHGGPSKVFYCLDACTDDLPPADTVMVREVLFHLSFRDSKALLCNVLRGSRRWIILTSDSGTLLNADIRTGDFRLLNLTRSPFSFPEPDMWISDSDLVPGRRMGVWAKDAIHGAVATK